MSTPSNNDGNSVGDDFYRGGLNPNIPQPQIPHYVSSVCVQQPSQSGQQPSPQFVHWPNPLMGGSPFIQQHHPHAPQQIFNDVLFNIQAQAAYASLPPTQVSSTAQQETYSVLRVGNGNFLKIYHCPENAMGPMPGETSFTPLHQFAPQPPPQPQTAYHHIQPQATIQPTQPQAHQQTPSHLPTNSNNGGAPQVFNSYELFSSNTFTQLPTAEMPPVLLLGATNNNLNAEPISMLEEYEEEQIETPLSMSPLTPNVTSNWLGGNTSINSHYENFENSQQMQTEMDYRVQSSQDSTKAESPNKNETSDMTSESPLIIQQNTSNQNVSAKVQPNEKPITIMKSTNSVLNHKTEIPRQDAPKKRIVAEVKPMRMTYSDVLSKINNQTQQNTSTYSSNSKHHALNPTANKHQQKSSVKSSSSSSSPLENNGSSNVLNPRRHLDEFSSLRTSSKKSPTHDNKENQNQQSLNNKPNKRFSTPMVGATIAPNNANNSSLNNANISSNNKSTATGTSSQKNSNNTKTNTNEQQQKKRSTKTTDTQANGAKIANDSRGGSAKNNATSSNTATASPSVYNAASNTYVRKATKSPNSSSSNTSAGPGPQRSRYQNISNASYSYSSTKRNRNSSTYGTSSSMNNSSFSHGSGNNRNYELAKRVLQAWYSYTVKILTWLFNLVYDIVVVGCSILYDRLTSGYEYCSLYVKQLYKDLKQNSNKPGIWFRNTCRRFDAKFSKTSKWAFWRKFFKKRPPETTGESIKTGRLPQTGEEAMYQLLNCKGKDAYSILGVPPNSSQEQIRKHYKKIAVLVHPDKNKQPGAEEAFKVLQRAFELIGEPENRLAYDQSLAEALHAEKAWTELHDLLSQLQTKITEAANTIRCSTCGLRHPRKITDRPHYAARECASCKIRHSAREGDIWAETSMLGLRWKYLALMEGKVYDITEWANCQKGALAHLEPNSHMVQYRIVRGAQQQQQQKQHHHQQQNQQHTGSHYAGGATSGKFKRDNIPTTEASLHEFLDNLYSGQHPQQQQQSTTYPGSSRRRNRRN
uniref:J domain-containing protein n=1 Tax=Stomoxys calcitrans TaxID=35570 RepID=A0A1I8NSS3_STOCA